MPSLVISVFLYACESWTLTAEIEKRTQAFEIRCYQRLLNVSYKDHVTNEEVHRKIQAAIGEYDGTPNHGLEMKTEVVWPCLKVSWFSKDNSTVHSEWKKKKWYTVDRRRSGKLISKSGQGWTLPAQQRQLKKDKT